ncbi:uncharacterized protein LOC109710460 [Ananas comosus]|uniref:Uncharacterized protein LOC109710460 n=1 Tax=Ananas comosus TaxID=4615 RepID=A0A6P5EYQ0_ANACO|nr:uncharacterized protein LOC109710460 [Ananas comosus]
MSSNSLVLARPESRRPGAMSSNSPVLTRSLALARPESRRPGDEHRPASPNHQGHQNWAVRVPRSLYHRMEEDDRDLHPWRLFEGRVRSGPYELARFPAQPYAPARVLDGDGAGGRGVNPRLREFLANSPPRIRREWNLPGEEPGLTEEEFKTAMGKLKKEVYNPKKKKTTTKTKTKTKPREGRGGAASSSSSSSGSNGGKGEEGEGMCTICLEAFAARESVLVTPCDHVFHGDCVAPWVRSHGRCPLCRFELCERRSGGGVGSGNGGEGEEDEDEEVGLGLALELVALLRAMEEALNWVGFSADIYRDVTIT